MKYGYMNYLSCMFILIIVVALPSLNVPMQSDDYSYLYKGLSFNEHYAHYMDWSGRVVADYISPLLLSTMPHTAYSLVNACAFSVLIILISSIPILRFECNSRRVALFSVFATFSMYWISNPNLGQTSFWIVGSANYMWTNMLIATSLSIIFYCIRMQRNRYELLFISSLLAGCTNENTSIVFVGLVIFICIYERPGKLFSTSIISGSLIGCMILLLAPGNYKRATFFGEWQTLSFAQKIFFHFSDRFPSAMGGYWQVYIFIFSALICIGILGVKNKSKLIYSLAFFIAAVMSNAAFALSPGMPARALNGSLCFLLISASFLLSDISYKSNKTVTGILTLSSTFLLFYLLPSYLLFNDAMRQTMAQVNVRERIIHKSIQQGVADINIPGFYFTRLIKESDRFDTFQSSDIARYYKVSSINQYPVRFNYAQIIDGMHNINVPFYGGANIVGIKFYTDSLGMDKHFLIEFDKNVSEYLSDDDALILHFNYDKGFVNRDSKLVIDEIDGRYFFSKDLNNIRINDVGSITIGIYDTKNNRNKFLENILI
ncbi:TPA: DUF6056 family protein [Citrobacter sedlakii]